MKALWSGRYRSITPRDFKHMVDASIPDMQGHAQQDANEFLAFLMNELHEDLNRIRDRVYVPEPDNSKLEERQMAALAWNNHVKRNNSVIVDYFQVRPHPLPCLLVTSLPHLFAKPAVQSLCHTSLSYSPPTLLPLPFCFYPSRACIAALWSVSTVERDPSPLNPSCTSVCPSLQVKGHTHCR